MVMSIITNRNIFIICALFGFCGDIFYLQYQFIAFILAYSQEKQIFPVIFNENVRPFHIYFNMILR